MKLNHYTSSLHVIEGTHRKNKHRITNYKNTIEANPNNNLFM